MHRPTSKFLLPLATLAGGALVGFQVGSSRARHKKPAESKSTSTEVQQSLNHSRAIHHGSAVPSVEASASDPAPRLADSLIARLRQLQAHPAMRWGVPSFASDVLVSDRLVIGFDRRARCVRRSTCIPTTLCASHMHFPEIQVGWLNDLPRAS